jgi:hypothetical protein
MPGLKCPESVWTRAVVSWRLCTGQRDTHLVGTGRGIGLELKIGFELKVGLSSETEFSSVVAATICTGGSIPRVATLQ